jgi:spore coat polysaccharide biosynthesis protein SpsF
MSGPEPVWGVVPGRMQSTRLPGKTMANLVGCPSLRHIIERLRRVEALEGIVVATSDDPLDDPIRRCAQAAGVPCYSGSGDDVLARTLEAARSVGAETIVNVNGDCPLVDPAVVQRVVDAYRAERPDYASNRLDGYTYPVGLDAEVYPTRLLAEIEPIATEPRDREHVTVYVYEHPERFTLVGVEAEARHRRPELRLTLDTPEDLALIRKIYSALHEEDSYFGLDKVLDYLDRNQELASLNRDVVQRAP